MTRIPCLLLVGLLAVGHLCARPVSEAETRHVATQWLAANPHLLPHPGDLTLSDLPSRTGACLVRKVATASGSALFIAADTRLPPLLAILPRDRISPQHPMLQYLKADIEARLEEAPQEDHGAWASLLAAAPPRPAQAPLYVFHAERWDKELNHWNQESFNRYGTWEEGSLYNRYTPEHMMVGCVAIAGCALQQFYAFPKEQRPYANPYCAVYKEAPATAQRPPFTTLETNAGPYPWEILPKQWQRPQTLTEAQSDLLARVAFNSGVLSATHYAAHASGGSTYFLMEGLRQGAGFATGMEYCPSPSVTMQAFLSGTLYNQLRCGAPCVLDLGGTSGNHAVLAVGLAEDHQQTLYTRLFFGWGGSGDVWYALPTQGSFHSILGVGTLLSVDGACLPIYGQLLRADGAPAAGETITLAGETLTTDAGGRFALRVQPQPSLTLTAGAITHTLTLNADLLQRAAVELWAEANPKAVSIDAFLGALPEPLTLQLKAP